MLLIRSSRYLYCRTARPIYIGSYTIRQNSSSTILLATMRCSLTAIKRLGVFLRHLRKTYQRLLRKWKQRFLEVVPLESPGVVVQSSELNIAERFVNRRG